MADLVHVQEKISFRNKAKEYGCSDDEIKFISDMISNHYGNKYLFTFPQFTAFCQYYSKFNGICFGSWSFTNYPKNNGIGLGGSVHDQPVNMTLMYLQTKHFKASFGTGFIEDIGNAWKSFQNCGNKLVLLIDSSNSENMGFHTLNHKYSKSFIGGGRIYCARVAQPMLDLEDGHKRYSSKLDAKERIIWY